MVKQMNVRAYTQSDVAKLHTIWLKHFKDEFDFPDFLNGYLCAVTIEDDKGNIITAGGVRLIAESVVVTDMSQSVKERRLALAQLLNTQEYICNKFGQSQLHAFIQDDTWYQHLHRVGFRPTAGKSLVLNF